MTEDELIVYFMFLDQLRRSGVTNMFGASRYLLIQYPDMDKPTSIRVLSAWMRTFNEDATIAERAAKAMDDFA